MTDLTDVVDQDIDIDSLAYALKYDGLDEASMYLQVKDMTKSIVDVSESQKILLHLESQRKKKELDSKIILTSKLDELSSVLINPDLRKDIGIPTSIAVGKNIVIGSSRGYTLVFNHFQELVVVLGARNGSEFGRVTAVDISKDSTWVATGHIGGQLVIWDLKKNKPLKTVVDIHTTAIQHLSFFENKYNLISLDTDGKINQLKVSNLIMVWVIEDTLVLNGGVGMIKDLQLLPTGNVHHPIDQYHLAAFSTDRKIVIISCGETVKIAQKISAPTDIKKNLLFPIICWRPAFCTVDGNALEPLLIVSWGKRVVMYQIGYSKEKLSPVRDLNFVSIMEYDFDVEITGITWLGKNVIVLVNKNEHLQLFDPFLEEELELKDIGKMELVYQKRYGKSKRKILSYQDSIHSYQGRIYLLGLKSLYGGHILSWSERIDAMVQESKWIEALGTAIGFYLGTGKAVVGLPPNEEQAKKVIIEKIEELLTTYVSTSLQKRNSDLNHFTTVAILAIDYCICINNIDILFTEIYRLFDREQKNDIFIDQLEPFLLGDKFQEIPMKIVYDIIKSYVEREKMQDLESLILHFNLNYVDKDLLLDVSRTHLLTSALFHIYIEGDDDYISPLDELMTLVLNRKYDYDTRSKIGYQILLYLSYCFSAKRFPTGQTIENQRYLNLREELFQYILQEKNSVVPERNYPNFVELIKLDIKELFKILSDAFDGVSSTTRLNDIFSVLQLIILGDNENITDKEKGELLTCMAKYVSRGMLHITKERLNEIVVFLIESNEYDQNTREESILDLCKNCKNDMDMEFVLHKAEEVKLYKVSEWFYRKSSNFKKVIECHLLDADFRKNIYTYLDDLVSYDSLSESDSEIVRAAIMKYLYKLIDLDNKQLALLVFKNFPEEHSSIYSDLEDTPDMQYKYLKGIFDNRHSYPMSDYIEENSISFNSNEEDVYLEYLCKKDPNSVLEFLKTSYIYGLDHAIELTEKFSISEASVYLYERAGFVERGIKIYIDRINDALDILAKEKISEVTDASNFPSTECELGVLEAINPAIKFCKRNSQKLDDAESEALWFELLDAFVIRIKDYRGEVFSNPLSKGSRRREVYKISKGIDIKSANIIEALTLFVRYILENLMGKVRMDTIMKKVVEDHKHDCFGDFKNIFVSMLDITQYQKNILKTAHKVLEDDAFKQSRILLQNRKRAFQPENVKVRKPDEERTEFEQSRRIRGCELPKDKSRLGMLRGLSNKTKMIESYTERSESTRRISLSSIVNKDNLKIGRKIPGRMDSRLENRGGIPDREAKKLFGK
eukprot:TRINITY_DN3334_c0_g1_i1.p1 TRINITY_DN3334_c0_g1~~TRINITY_DN3334_c0_g1_i1.p1  ORF type:complete len:1330 (-),score=304.47 TRINITY_DN3334_c0_g1_i1:81-3971(-)